MKVQAGASLIMAVFMIVVFSMLATAMVKMLSISSENTSYEVIGTRTYMAADIGNQWALQQLFPMAANSSDCSVVTGGTFPNISNTQGLKGCRIDNIECSEFDEAGVTYFTVVSTGFCSAGSVSTNRTLQIDARSL